MDNNTDSRADEARSHDDWRTRLRPESRQLLINKLMEDLKNHHPSAREKEMLELVVRFEERIYTSSNSQNEYVRNISQKMQAIETKSTPRPEPGTSNQNVAELVSGGIQAQVHNQSQKLHMPITGNQSQARQQVVSRQSQNPRHLLDQKFPHRSMFQSLVQPHMQQQQQQQYPSQQSQHSIMQSTIRLQNQQSSTQQSAQASLPQHSPHIRQQIQKQPTQQSSMIHPENSSVRQRILASQQQQPQPVGTPPSGTNIQQNQIMSQPNSIPEMLQHPSQLQRMIGQHCDMSNLQTQQLPSQQGNLSNMHQRQISRQNNVNLIQQPHTTGLGSNNTSMSGRQQNVHMLQQSTQQPLQQSASLVPTQGRQSQQMQLPQQQLMPQIELQQQIGYVQQLENTSQRDMQTSTPFLHHQNAVDPQKQLFQPQRKIPDGPSSSTSHTGSVHGGYWKEVAYQKITSMKEMYFVEINEYYQKVASKLGQCNTPQQPKHEKLERLKCFKDWLVNILNFLGLDKNDIQIGHRDQIGQLEKQIVMFLNANRPHNPNSSMSQGQLTQSRIHAMQQNQQSESQISQMQPHESRMSSQVQSSMNIQGSVLPQQNQLSESQISQIQPHERQVSSQMQSSLNIRGSVVPMQQNDRANVQHNSLPSASNISNREQSIVNSLQTGSCLDATHSNAQSSLQQVVQPPLLQQQFLHTQPILLPQQEPAQFPSPTVSQIHQMNEASNLEIRQQLGLKSGILPQHHPAGRHAYRHPQLKSGSLFISSPSPQVPQHISQQIDQQNMPTPTQKAGTPFQSLSSPCILPSPSTPFAPSPTLEETEKVNTGVSPLSYTGAIGHQRATVPSAPAQSIAIDTPGISASPLLAEFTSPDGTHGVGDEKSTAVEQPHDRLVRGLKSISPKALVAAVSDICAVVTMVDRMAGETPCNGLRSAVSEDLVSTTKRSLHAKNFFTQEGQPESKKMRRYTSGTASCVFPSASSVHDRQTSYSEASDLKSTVKQPLENSNRALTEEMLEVNQRLIDTTIEISNQGIDPSIDPWAISIAGAGGEGTIVKCSYNAVALSQNLKALYASAQMAPIQPLWFLVPNNYPRCSPIPLDKFPVESSSEYDLSVKVKSKFSISLRSLSQPASLSDLARTWDGCARAVITEYAQQTGGGTFSSKYGTWENCLIAA